MMDPFIMVYSRTIIAFALAEENRFAGEEEKIIRLTNEFRGEHPHAGDKVLAFF